MFFKNVAGQVFQAHMVNTDGSAFSGTVTVYIEGNNGTQTIGSVGSGVCTSKGNGSYSYLPSQAETNYDCIKLTFIGTGAVPVGQTIYPTDLAIYGVLATGTLSGTHSATSADLGTSAPSYDIVGRTLVIPSRGFSALVDTYDTGTGVATFVSTSASLTDGDNWLLMASPKASSANPIPANVVAIAQAALANLFDTDSGTTFASAVTGSVVRELAINAGLSAAGIRSALGMSTANLDTQLGDIPTVSEFNARTLVAASYATASALSALSTLATLLASGIITGAAVTGTLSTTQATTNLTGYTDGQLVGRVIIWTSGAAEGECTDITGYSASTGLITYTAMTVAPGNGDTFKIV